MRGDGSLIAETAGGDPGVRAVSVQDEQHALQGETNSGDQGASGRHRRDRGAGGQSGRGERRRLHQRISGPNCQQGRFLGDR